MSEWARPTPDTDDSSEPFEVFATGTTLVREHDDLHLDVHTISHHLHRGAEAVRDGYEHAREFHARPGHRPGRAPLPMTSHREGGGTDIVRPVLIDPAVASRLATSGALFARPVHHLTIERHDRDPERYLVWDACLTPERGREVPATLHLLGSPSMVVTVLELVPCRRVRWRRGRFVREGIAAIEELAHRLEAIA